MFNDCVIRCAVCWLAVMPLTATSDQSYAAEDNLRFQEMYENLKNSVEDIGGQLNAIEFDIVLKHGKATETSIKRGFPIAFEVGSSESAFHGRVVGARVTVDLQSKSDSDEVVDRLMQCRTTEDDEGYRSCIENQLSDGTVGSDR